MEHSNDLILGSQSPRRQELLRAAGFSFRIEKIDIDESFPEDQPPHEVAEYLAQVKNLEYRKRFENSTVLTADTTVVLENQILGKPADKEEAFLMISKLSGRWHEVVTGICISSNLQSRSDSEITRVKFRTLSSKEINYYINTFEPFDKAGAYGIQEWIGMVGIERIEGSYFNVVGMPVQRVYELLHNNFGYSTVD